ncbi:MAG: hypothetical protein ACKO0Z_00045 [Betaproteobacteria bacterium]
MKKFLVVIAGVAGSTALNAQSVYVSPHIRADGTYVQGHWRTAPNNTRTDNWSSRPNVNPWTGQVGRDDPYAPRQTYQSPYNGTYSTPYSNRYRRGY